MEKWKIKAIIAAIFVAILSVIVIQHRRIGELKTDRDKYKENTVSLLTDVERYKVRDSLNAARVQSLELTQKEFERFRAEDARLIAELTGKNRDLAAMTKTQAQTIIDLQAVPRDTVVIVRDSIQVPAVSVHCGDAWFDFDGILAQDQFTGQLKCRDSLVVAESVKYRRFLGFLWKTHKVKDRRIDVVSRNPHTEIIGVEHIFLEK